MNASHIGKEKHRDSDLNIILKIHIYIYIYIYKHYSGLLFPLDVEDVVQARGLLCRLHLRSRWFGHILAEPYLPCPPWCAGSKPPCAQSHHQFPARVDSAAAGPSVFSLRLRPVGYLASEPTTPAPRSPWRAGLKPECSERHQQFPAPVDSEDVSD